MRRPTDLGNDQFAIRTTSEGVMKEARLRVEADMRKHEDRVIIRRMARRMLELCDWWEAQKDK